MNHRLVSNLRNQVQKKCSLCRQLTFQMLMSAVFLLTFRWRPIFPRYTQRGKSLFFTFLLISYTITTLSDACHRDWDFNFAPASPRRSHELTFKFCGEGLLCSGPPLLTACISNHFWKGERLYGGLRYPSLPATCGSCLMALPCMSDGALGTSGPQRCSPLSITSASCHLRHHRWVTGDSFVLLNFSP